MSKWNVVFVASGGLVILTVEADDDDAAISVALEMGLNQFGFDLSSFSAEASPAYDSDILL